MASPALVALFIAACHGAALAAPSPDSASLARIQERARAAWRVKATTTSGTFLLSRPRLDAAGVMTPRGPLEWAEIQSLDAQGPSGVRRAIGGTLIGAGAGFILGAAYYDIQLEGADGGVIVPFISAASGAAIGMVVGIVGRKRGERIYP